MSTETCVNQDILTNPLVKKSILHHNAPHFDQIKFEHFESAIRYGIKKQLEEIDEITKNSEEPTFENTIVAFEQTGAIFSRATSCFYNFAGTDSTDEIMELEDVLSSVISNHGDDLYLNEELFQRVSKVHTYYMNNKTEFSQKYEPIDVRLLTNTYENFVLNGALLSKDDKILLRSYNETLSSLENKFSQNLLKIEANDYLVIDSVDELDGLAQDEIIAAGSLATEKGLDGKYVLNLVNTTRNPALLSLNNRALREKVFNLSINRGFKQGETAQQDIVCDILLHRAKIAKLLGHKSFSDYKLTREMAKTPQAALQLLTSMMNGVVEAVKIEREQLLEELKLDKTINNQEDAVIKAHDWEYYAEKVRAKKYNVDPAVVREYFTMDNVLHKCTFEVFNKLYGITFKERFDLPVYHPDVKVYEVFDHDGKSISIFYGDYFKRQGKSGGAWMSDFVPPAKINNQHSVTQNVMNVVKTDAGFIPFADVSTVNHELGHFFHSASSFNVKYQSLASTNTSSDFVEFPSTFHEDFCLVPEILQQYAKHYQTGESLDPELLKSVIKSQQFNNGFETYEYLAAALIDLEWHSLSITQLEELFSSNNDKATIIQKFEIDTLKKYNAYVDCIYPRYRTQYFNHSMTSYSSRYYAYIWSEILAADAHRFIMKEKGGLTFENGNKIRNEVFSRGNSRDLMESYVAFRGQEPTSEALLIRRGLAIDPLAPQ